MNILLITPNFFDYPKQIKEELERMGHSVDWYDDRPSTNSFVKAIIRVNRKVIKKYIKKYFDRIMREIEKQQYDRVIVVSGQSFSFDESMLLKLKNVQNKAKFILYQWDSEVNFQHIVGLQKYFDRCYSFDRKDVEANSNLEFLPLFYSRKYEAIGKSKRDNYKYDAMFVGTAHPKKYRLIKEMSEKLADVYSEQFIYFYLPSTIVFYYRKLKNKEFKKTKKNWFNYTSVTSKEMDDLLIDSLCVLDSAQDGQNGLTIRVIETLGAKRKLITTNEDIINYDFYKPENIYVYNGEFDFNSTFFSEPYTDIDEEIYEKYSLRNWLNELTRG